MFVVALFPSLLQTTRGKKASGVTDKEISRKLIMHCTLK
jgi:hypothetical protein